MANRISGEGEKISVNIAERQNYRRHQLLATTRDESGFIAEGFSSKPVFCVRINPLSQQPFGLVTALLSGISKETTR
ncbi:hypothetical protein KCP73_23000 [Salmonella enterica subsp. enterica]|nr:hypothetical protein KCP73_23000 [Salmonella enterica subsp. enterica]